VLQPERLFGMTQRYSRDFTALTQCNMLTISKTQVVQLMEKYEVFRINLLNIITTQTQRQERQPLRQQPTQIREKIMRFVTDRSIYPTGRKTLNVKMEVLARLIGESRQNVSDELHRMEEDGVIELRRGIISMMPYKEYRHL
jgi:CRP-like cAMP-binding protein